MPDAVDLPENVPGALCERKLLPLKMANFNYTVRSFSSSACIETSIISEICMSGHIYEYYSIILPTTPVLLIVVHGKTDINTWCLF